MVSVRFCASEFAATTPYGAWLGTLMSKPYPANPDVWIVAGTSQTADMFTRLARHRYPFATTITTNAGHKLFCRSANVPMRRPDYYYLSDAVACAEFIKPARELRGYGTKLVTLKRSPSALQLRGVSDFDIFLDVPGPGATWQFRKGDYTDWSLSGLYTIQFAINNGAKLIHIAGHEGYRNDDRGCRHDDHFDGSRSPDNGALLTEVIIRPAMQAMIDACPDVQFHYYGPLAYEVHGHNVSFTANNEAVRMAMECN